MNLGHHHILAFFLFLMVAIGSQSLQAQSDIIFTKSFTKKLQRSQLEFFHPIERWLKVAPEKKDGYIRHDITLHSPPDTEVRIKIWKPKKRKKAQNPNVMITTTLATIATNDDDAIIRMRPMSMEDALDVYGADLALEADFIPKSSYANYPKGRMLCIYNEETDVLVSYIILYEDQLDPFFRMPIRFKGTSSYN